MTHSGYSLRLAASTALLIGTVLLSACGHDDRVSQTTTTERTTTAVTPPPAETTTTTVTTHKSQDD
jgi:hypothetical protein